MRRIRVVHVIPRFVSHGAEWMVLHLLASLDRERFDLHAVSLYGPQGGSLESALAHRGVPVHYLGKRRGFDPRMYHRLWGALRRIQPDLIHSHLALLHYLMPCALFCRPAKMVHTVHSLAEREAGAATRWIHRAAFLKGVVPVAVSSEVARSLERVYRIPNCRVIPNGIPVDRYRKSATRRQAWRAQQGFGERDVLLTCAARLNSVKNHALLIQAFAAATIEATSKDAPPVHLLLAGEGELLDSLRRAAAERGIENRVHFLGARNDMPDLLSASDVFVLASLWEGNPLSVMEAMSAGLPVIATRVGGIPELVEDGTQGILVPSNSPADFAAAIARLAGSPVLRQAMSAEAEDRANRLFHSAAMARAYAQLYEFNVHGVSRSDAVRSRICARNI